MEQLEKVEKLREKTGVTYEEAKAALEVSNWDMLDAIVYLENQGKIKGPNMSSYSTRAQNSQEFQQASQNYDNCGGKTFGEMMDKFFCWCGKVIKKGCESYFEVTRDRKNILNMPVIVLVLLVICFFWVTIPLLIIGMFCGFRYSFHGDIAKTVDINSACDKMAETCENIKKDFNHIIRSDFIIIYKFFINF